MGEKEKVAVIPVKFYPFPGGKQEGLVVGRNYSVAAVEQTSYRICAVPQRNFNQSSISSIHDLIPTGILVSEFRIMDTVEKHGERILVLEVQFEPLEVFHIEALNFSEELGCFVAEGRTVSYDVIAHLELTPTDKAKIYVLAKLIVEGVINSQDLIRLSDAPRLQHLLGWWQSLNKLEPTSFLSWLLPHWSDFLRGCYVLLESVGSQTVIFAEDYEKVFLADNPVTHLEELTKIIRVLNTRLKTLMEIQEKVVDFQNREGRAAYLRSLLHITSQELKELGKFAGDDEADDLIGKIDENEHLPPDLKEKLKNEVMSVASQQSPERPMVFRYVNFVLSLPWGKFVEPRKDFEEVKKILDDSHYGLDEVKERVLEYLGLYLHLGKPPKGNILCFVGPPGTGKTSMAAAVAEALGLPFQRISLGGVDDEAEIRGHRRTYVAAMAGRIASALQRLGAMNGVIFLDEIDKMGVSIRGRPDAALLDVLDPDRNHEFVDHYVDYPIDLSNILFICGANRAEDINPTLLNRMEIIVFSGYLSHEKKEIIRNFIVPRIKNEWNLPNLSFDSDVIDYIVSKYGNAESGVRLVKRSIESLVRKALALGKELIDLEFARQHLIPPPPRVSWRPEMQKMGIIPLLVVEGSGEGNVAWAEIIKHEIEAEKWDGKKISDWVEIVGITDASLEKSVHAAYLWFVNHVLQRKGKPCRFTVSFPMVAVEKKGPSAGAAIALGFYLTYLGRKWDKRIAITGEISPSGEILPVGGLIPKLVAADNFNFSKVFFPRDNQEEVEYWLRRRHVNVGVEIRFVSHINEVLESMR